MKYILITMLALLIASCSIEHQVNNATSWEGCVTNYYNDNPEDENRFDQTYQNDLAEALDNDLVMALAYGIQGQTEQNPNICYHDFIAPIEFRSGRTQFCFSKQGVYETLIKIYRNGHYEPRENWGTTVQYFGTRNHIDSITYTYANSFAGITVKDVIYDIEVIIRTDYNVPENNSIGVTYKIKKFTSDGGITTSVQEQYLGTSFSDCATNEAFETSLNRIFILGYGVTAIHF